LEIASDQAGHSDPKVTKAHYIGDTELEELASRASFVAVFDTPFLKAV